MKTERKDEYAALQRRLMRQVFGSVALSALIVAALYLLVWKQRMGDLVVRFMETVLRMNGIEAYYFYDRYFRGNKDFFFIGAILVIFVVLLWHIFRRMNRYFNEINDGIGALLTDGEGQVRLSPEMLPFERKLNAVKQELEQRREETALAEQRKNELVMYLAHDIRTPLTSVIGYLDLLEEEPDMPAELRAKRVHIALEKACRLETMINEFFEITRYNSQQITLTKQNIDLYYMLVQLSDELSPSFARRGSRVVLRLEEDLTVMGDADKLARVFGNILKNAAAYSYPNTEITVSAERAGGRVLIHFQNQGDDIPAESLEALFDKFYRADKARSSDTGGTGLGLAIAREIVTLHGGTIEARSGDHTITFTVALPGGEG